MGVGLFQDEGSSPSSSTRAFFKNLFQVNRFFFLRTLNCCVLILKTDIIVQGIWQFLRRINYIRF